MVREALQMVVTIWTGCLEEQGCPLTKDSWKTVEGTDGPTKSGDVSLCQ